MLAGRKPERERGELKGSQPQIHTDRHRSEKSLHRNSYLRKSVFICGGIMWLLSYGRASDTLANGSVAAATAMFSSARISATASSLGRRKGART